ncbi:MAG: phosphoribosyltransferase family protein [Acidimicrobiales bacterium]
MYCFSDRQDAGRQLAAALVHLKADDVVVVGLPRGGVPVAYEVALALDAPLDVLVVRKLGVPFQPELAMGALGEGGVLVVDDEVMAEAGISEAEFAAVERRERAELEDRVRRLRRGRPLVPLTGRTVVVVDDGIATGSTARAACLVARAHGAKRVVLATPVAARQSIERLASHVDEFVCVEVPERAYAVGQWYRDFAQTTDEEVLADLDRAAARPERPAGAGRGPGERDEEVAVRIGNLALPGHLSVPRAAGGLVIFAHGSGSSRHSPRNRLVAESLNRRGLGTLLFDLLTPAEERDRANVFDIDLLSTRLFGATRWLEGEPEARGLGIGYFGASTGAGAALVAAARAGCDIGAVVSRGGRVDMAGPALAEVRAPVLLLVGGDDEVVLEFNRQAQRALTCESRLEVIAGAGHLFEEPGTLERVAELAGGWFSAHLAGGGGDPGRPGGEDR